MSRLPEHPDLNQARRQAKELLQAAKRGEGGALMRLAAEHTALADQHATQDRRRRLNGSRIGAAAHRWCPALL